MSIVKTDLLDVTRKKATLKSKKKNYANRWSMDIYSFLTKNPRGPEKKTFSFPFLLKDSSEN